MSRYNVLWIDDDPTEEFMNEAAEYDIDIVLATCHNDGVKLLENSQNNWDAIILDANCKITNDKYESPTLKSLRESINHIIILCSKDLFIPWFVYTGGGYEGYEFLSTLISEDRDWDDRKYYNKPSQRYELFENLKKATEKQSRTHIKHKYSDVWKIYSHDDILKILLAIEAGEIKNASIFNDIRKVVDWIMSYCNKCGILPIEFTGSNLGECSIFLGKKEMKPFVPIYIQRSIHSCVEIANNGSHRLEIDDIVKSGNAPYLLKSTVFELLNILYWCKSLPTEEGAIVELREKTSFFILPTINDVNKFEYIEGIIDQDKNRNYYCGPCMLNYRDISYEDIGKHIVVKKHTENTQHKTKELYPYFASKQNFDIKD